MRSSIFSFDYELFLGSDSGQVDKCLIHPTQKILKILNRHAVRGVFFIDTIYLIRLQQLADKNERARADFEMIGSQLVEIRKHNHYLFIHLHPHWLDAVYNEDCNTWDLSDNHRYRLTALTHEEQRHYFNTSLLLLSSILSKNAEEIGNGYRAGGWSITPFTTFRPHFIEHGIKYDFTVIPGKILHSNVQHYDFTHAPNKRYYRFNDVIDQEDANGPFTEFPVSVYTMSRFFSVLSDYYEKLFHFLTTRFFKQKSKGKTASASNTIVSEFTSADGKPLFVSQFEDLNIFLFISMLLSFRKRNHLHSISHPKLFTFWDFIYLKLFLLTFNHKVTTDFLMIEKMN